jgi:hypothetical protein
MIEVRKDGATRCPIHGMYSWDGKMCPTCLHNIHATAPVDTGKKYYNDYNNKEPVPETGLATVWHDVDPPRETPIPPGSDGTDGA